MKNKLILFLVMIGVIALIGSCTSAPTPEEHGLSPETVELLCEDLREEYPDLFQFQYFQEFCADTTPTPTTTVVPTTTTEPPATTTTVAPTTTTTTTVPPGGMQPNGPSGNFRLAWNDEFNGTSLDLNKWRPNWLAGNDTAVTPPVNTLELSCYDPANVSVGGGVVTLTADRDIPEGCRTRNGSANYASGMIQTNSDYRFTYGYTEARLNIPGSCSRAENWPAFWTNGQSWPRDGEIDIMEALDGSSTWHYHWSGGSAGGRGDHLDCESGWHTFGAEWSPGRLEFFYDGRSIGTHTSGVVSTEHYIILNHALSSEISPPVVTPSVLQADYVRHWVRA